MIGDGDSSTFGEVKEACEEEYGERYMIVKEDCVGQIQKRMGTALRKYKKDTKNGKLADGKGVGSKGRLTDAMIDEIQGLYGKAIRSNKGNLQGMKDAVWALFNHKISSSTASLKHQHRFCPKGSESWCKFNKDVANKTHLYNEDRRLPEAFRKELLPIFTRLADEELLKRCLSGLTQNQNESVNGQLWLRCPKAKFSGIRRVEIAVCETVGVFNIGASYKADVMEQSGINPGTNMLKSLRAEDSRRIVFAGHKISEKYIVKRRNKRK